MKTISYKQIMALNICYNLHKEVGMPKDYEESVVDFIDEYRNKLKYGDLLFVLEDFMDPSWSASYGLFLLVLDSGFYRVLDYKRRLNCGLLKRSLSDVRTFKDEVKSQLMEIYTDMSDIVTKKRFMEVFNEVGDIICDYFRRYPGSVDRDKDDNRGDAQTVFLDNAKINKLREIFRNEI